MGVAAQGRAALARHQRFGVDLLFAESHDVVAGKHATFDFHITVISNSQLDRGSTEGTFVFDKNKTFAFCGDKRFERNGQHFFAPADDRVHVGKEIWF